MKKAYSTQIKTIIKGDYYQIGQKGAYHRHRDVSVKCCQNQQDYKQQQQKKLVHQMQIQNSNISINQNSESSIQTPKYQHRKNSQFGSRSPFLQDCIKILEKEEVNSIHEQDSQQIKNKSNIINEKNLINLQKRDKNSKMRRSSQNQTSPKKGILKRSMNDKKQEEIRSSYRNHGQQNNYITDRPVRMQYIQNMNPKQRERLQLLQQEQLAAQRYKSAQSIDNQSLRSRQYYHNNIQKSLRQINQNPGPYTQTARIFNQGHSGRVNFPNSHRVHTEGKETVVVNNRYNNRQQNGFVDDLSNNYDHLTYNVYQSINFLNQRFKYLENQLINKQKKLKVIQLQRTLKIKSQQMNRLKKQNQQLKNKKQHIQELKSQQKQARRCSHDRSQESSKKSSIKINYEGLGLQKLQPWIQLAEQKATFIISFLVVLFMCIMLGKSGSTCSK